MTNPKIRDAKVAVRLLCKRLERAGTPLDRVFIGHAQNTINAGLDAAEATVAEQPAPAVKAPEAPTNRQLEDDVIFAALHFHRLQKRLAGFGASARTMNRELTQPMLDFDAAVERLAAARAWKPETKDKEVGNG